MVISALLIGTLDFYHLIPLSATLNLTGGHKVSTKPNPLLSFSPTVVGNFPARSRAARMLLVGLINGYAASTNFIVAAVKHHCGSTNRKTALTADARTALP